MKTNSEFPTVISLLELHAPIRQSLLDRASRCIEYA